MFWGLIMEPQRRYTQNVKKAFHVSMAALDISSSDSEPTQIMCGFEGRNYLLCTLQKGKLIQSPLDLNFEVGDEVSFATNGNSHVHLTGYLTDEFAGFDEEQGEEEEDDNEISPGNKKRNRKSTNGPAMKRLKTAELLDAVNSQESDDDSDFNFSDLLKEDEEDLDDEEDEDDEEGSEDAENDDDVEEEESEDDDDDTSSLSDEEEEEQDEKPKRNGTPLPNKLKNKQIETPKQKTKESIKTPKQEEKQQKTPKSEKKAQKGNNEFKEEKTPNKIKLKQENNKSPKSAGDSVPPKKRTVEGGIVIEELKQGDGQIAKPGKICQVYYEGRLKNNNKLFDATNKGPGFKFRLGRGEVIKGWDVGVSGMKVGGKRRIVCPPSVAYGQKGSPPAIPPNSTLVFEVELKAVL